MNPQASWDQLLAAYAAGNWEAIEEHANELIEHLDRGGLPPAILEGDIDPDWNRALARAGCQFALDVVQREWSTVP